MYLPIKLNQTLKAIFLVWFFILQPLALQVSLSQKACTLSKGEIRNIEFSEDGQSVISTWDQDKVKLWDTKTGNLINTFSIAPRKVLRVAISPNGKYILAISVMNFIWGFTLWDAESSIKLEEMISRDINSSPIDVNFSPNSRFLLITDIHGGHIYSLPQGKEIYLLSTRISEERSQVAQISNDSKLVLIEGIGVSEYNNSYLDVELWDVQTGIRMHTFPGDHGIISIDGKSVITVTNEFTQWDAQTGVRMYTFDPKMLAFEAFSMNGKYALVQSLEGPITLIDIQKHSNIYTFEPIIQSVIFFPDYMNLLLEDRSILEQPSYRIWNIGTRKVITSITPEKIINIFKISPDNHTMIAVSIDEELQQFDLDTGNKVRVLCG